MRESLSRASLLSFVSSNVMVIVGLALNVLIARSLGPTAKGLYAVFLNTQGLLIVPSFAVEMALIYVIVHRHPSRSALDHFIRRIAVIQAVLSVADLAFAIQLTGMRRLLFGGLNSVFLVVLLVILVVAFWERYRATILPGIQQYGRFAILGAVATVVNSGTIACVLVASWALHTHLTIETLVVATTGGMLLSAVVWWRATAKVAIPGEGEATVASLFSDVRSYGWPVLLRNVIEWASYRIDVYLVTALSGALSVGLYTVAEGAAQQLWLIPFAIANPLFNRVAHDGDTPESRGTAQYAFKLATIIALVLGLAAAVSGPILLPVVYGSAFSGSSLPFLLYLPGVVAAAGAKSFNSYFAGCKRNLETVKAEAVAVVVIISLDIALVPRFGASGAAATASIAYTCSSVVLTFRFVTIARIRWRDLIYLNTSERTRLVGAISAVTRRLPLPGFGYS